MKPFHWLAVALCTLCLSLPVAAEEPPPVPTIDEVTDFLDELYRSKSSHGELEMEVVTADFSRTLKMEMWTKGEDLALVVIRDPAKEAGTATLRTDEGMWNYAPRADRLIRIPSGMLSDGWMGSHMTNDDMMRETSWTDDYDTKLEWRDADGETYLVATSTPKADASVVYTKVVQWLTWKDWLPVKAEYFDGEDLVRVFRFDEVKELGGRTIPTVLTLEPQEEEGEYTRFEYLEMEFDLEVKDSIFTQRGLRKAAQR